MGGGSFTKVADIIVIWVEKIVVFFFFLVRILVLIFFLLKKFAELFFDDCQVDVVAYIFELFNICRPRNQLCRYQSVLVSGAPDKCIESLNNLIEEFFEAFAVSLDILGHFEPF